MRVLFSYPLRFDKKGIGLTAWQQVNGLAGLGVDVDLFCASCHVDMDRRVNVHETLRPFGIKIPLRFLKNYSFLLHDRAAAMHLTRHSQEYDVVHCWPSGARATLKVAREKGIVSFLERPSSHTRFVFETVENECRKLKMSLTNAHYARSDAAKLKREEEEFAAADYLLCPSEFVAKTFMQEGFKRDRLLSCHYGYDTDFFSPGPGSLPDNDGLKLLFVGNLSPLKGLHYALEAWLKSEACEHGKFYICGDMALGYEPVVRAALDHPSVTHLGFLRGDELRGVMRSCDVLILPSLTEGSALVTYEARACGCALMVSDASGAWGKDGVDLFLHKPGDVQSIVSQINRFVHDEDFLRRSQQNAVKEVAKYTWSSSVAKLAAHYRAESARKNGATL